MTGFLGKFAPIVADSAITRTRWLDSREYLRNPRFWIIQGMVLLATLIHAIADAFEIEESPHLVYLFAVLMFGLFVIPVTYASLHFGKRGAIPTAIWAGILAIPIIVIWNHGVEGLAEASQHLLIIFVAVIIASRVDREAIARRELEVLVVAREHSETRLRALFEAAGEAILVFDESGRIRETNEAAAELFGIPRAALMARALSDFLDADNAKTLLSLASDQDSSRKELLLFRPDGSELWLEPVCSSVQADDEWPLFQALFRDVTSQRLQRTGLEAFARQIMAAQEEERRRISRDLHDGPLQALVLLCRDFDQLSVKCDGAGEQASAELKKARLEAEGIAAELRRFSRDLRPSILDDLGLEPAVRWLVKDVEQRTGIRGRFVTGDEMRRMSPATELGLFRIAQEAVRNVEKHAGATEVVVELSVMPDQVRLRIADNGSGIVADKLPNSGTAQLGKLGLLGMQERVRLLHGELRLESEPGVGTRIEVTIPTPG